MIENRSKLGAAALFAPLGTSTTSMNQIDKQRTWDLGHSLRNTNEHLNGKLHDVYPLSVLSTLHLERPINGRPLGAWISDGGRGDIIPIEADVHAWIVPDEVRPLVREALFESGSLIASV